MFIVKEGAEEEARHLSDDDGLPYLISVDCEIRVPGEVSSRPPQLLLLWEARRSERSRSHQSSNCKRKGCMFSLLMTLLVREMEDFAA